MSIFFIKIVKILAYWLIVNAIFCLRISINVSIFGLYIMHIYKSKEGQEQKRELFFATLTHDMKNSVQAQLTGLNILNNEAIGTLNPAQKEIVTTVIESVSYINEMFFSVLNDYKYDNEIIRLNKIEFNVEDLIQTCINESRIIIYEKGLHIHCDVNVGEKQLYADARQLRRVISNLLNNAVNYAINGTKLKIHIFVRNNKMVFEFSNVSKPIPEDVKKRLFEKYVTGAYTMNKQGFGLGLYMSKKIVEAHKGKIYFRMENNENIFAFEIPLKKKRFKF